MRISEEFYPFDHNLACQIGEAVMDKNPAVAWHVTVCHAKNIVTVTAPGYGPDQVFRTHIDEDVLVRCLDAIKPHMEMM